jgi:drug/metabolite transporter (DMT)-like permease
MKASRSSALVAIITWSMCSATLVIYNKYVLHGMKFHYPMFITLLHCLGVSVSLFLASMCFNLFEPPHKMNSISTLVRSMMPISIIFTVATVMRNFAFIYLPVPNIQIINSSAPAVSYIISCLVGIEKFKSKMAFAVGGISAGVCLSAASAMRSTSSFGAALLFGGLVLEATRGVLLKKLLNNNVSKIVIPFSI